MWIRLGDNELINLNHVRSIRKGEENTMELHIRGLETPRKLPFETQEGRDDAFDNLFTSLVKAGEALA